MKSGTPIPSAVPALSQGPGSPVLRVIQVGLGAMGNHWLRTIIAAMPEVELAAVVEPQVGLAQERLQQYDLDPRLHFTSLVDALQGTDAEGVLIVTPPASHAPLSLLALEAGLPVLSEKPMADSLEAAHAILRKSQETGVLHMVAQDYRYSPQAQTVRHVLDTGELGRVGAVLVQFYKGPHFDRFHDQLRYPLIMDMAIHHFDLMRFFLGTDPVRVQGKSWNPSWSWFQGDAAASLILEFTDGVVVSYSANWCAMGQETPWNGSWRFECEHGVLLLDDDQVYIQRRTDELEDVDGFRRYVNGGLEHVPLIGMPRARQAYLLQEFRVALQTGRPPVTLAEDNIKSYRMVWDAIKSFEAGVTVRVV